MKMNHNKKRNTAFLFESLVREITKAAIKNDNKKKAVIASVIKEFFYKQKILNKELTLYKEVYRGQGLSKDIAEKILEEVKEEYKKIDRKEVFNEQTRLINKINKMIGPGAFNNFVPNYKALASIYQIFNKTMAIKSRVLLEAKVVNSMCTKIVAEQEEMTKVTKPVLKIFTNKFKTTYKNLLEEQQILLHQYITSVRDNGLELKTYINEEIHRIKEELNLYSKKNKEDKLVREKIQKILEVIEGFKGEYISEEMLSKLLKLQKLAVEIKKDG
jgi:predicted GNAT family acetyltransferase